MWDTNNVVLHEVLSADFLPFCVSEKETMKISIIQITKKLLFIISQYPQRLIYSMW